MADYLSLVQQSPGIAAAGAALARQITDEGQAQGKSASTIQETIVQAHTQLADTYSTLVDSGNGFQLPADGPKGIIDCAQQAVTAAHTTIGAVTGIANLLSAASSGSPAQVVAAGNVIVGTLIGVAVTAGAVSAGVGAIIVAGAALVGEALSALSGPPPVATVCSNNLNFQPSIVVGCVFTQGAPRSPGSPLWRHFPEPNQASDAGWFARGTPNGWSDFTTTSWLGDTWSGGYGPVGDRLIDRAFPKYRLLMAEQALAAQTTGAFGGFRAAFLTAWKSNQSYALNGLKTQDDARVLLQTVNMWNAAHEPGQAVIVAPGDAHIGAYESTLIEQAIGWWSGDSQYVSANGVQVNQGAIRAMPKVASLQPHFNNAPGPSTPTSSGSALGKSVLVAAGIGVASTLIYSKVTHTSLGEIWKDAKRGVGLKG